MTDHEVPDETATLYDQTATRWQRREPSSLSDFTGRPAVFEMCGDVDGKSVLDLGCGEGYCARVLASKGANRILGLELSEEMVALAVSQEEESPFGIEYLQADLTAGFDLDEQFDLAVAVFLFNYTTTAEMTAIMKNVHHSLVDGGTFVFSVPHPAFGFMSNVDEPFFFDVGDRGYFSGEDTLNKGRIFRRDGTPLEVQMKHRPVESYFSALAAAGFTSMPVVRELRVLPEHMEMDPDFFGPVNDVPLHMAFSVAKN